MGPNPSKCLGSAWSCLVLVRNEEKNILPAQVVESPPEPASWFPRLHRICEKKTSILRQILNQDKTSWISCWIKTSNMASAFPNIWYYISEKELMREKVGIFYFGAWEVAWSLQARLAGLHGFYDHWWLKWCAVALVAFYHYLYFGTPCSKNLLCALPSWSEEAERSGVFLVCPPSNRDIGP